MGTPLSGCSRIAAIKDQLSTDLGDETIILDLEKGVYYGLGQVGGRIWHLLQEEHSVDEIQAICLQEYDVAPDRCKRDILELLGNLAEENLITVADVTSS